MPEIVEDDQRAVRPAAQDRAIEAESIYDRANIIGPQPGVGVGVARFGREAMPAQIHRDEAMVTRQLGVQLSTPGQPRLASAVDEQNGPATRVAGLDDVEL